MIGEENDEVMVEIMDDDSRVSEKNGGEVNSKFQDEGYGGESNDEDLHENNKWKSSASCAPEFSKASWTEILEEVQPVPSILFSEFPAMALRYKLIICRLKATIDELPLSQDHLPTHIKLCKSTIKILQKQKKNYLWENYSNSESLDQLENSFKLLFSLMVSIAIELKIGSDIIRINAKYAIKQNKKQTETRTHTLEDKEKDKDKKGELNTHDGKVDKSKNKWIDISEEIQPIAPILLQKFPKLTDQYEFCFDGAKVVIRNLPSLSDKLPEIARSCKEKLKSFHEEKKKGLWDDFANISVELEQLENTIIFVLSKVVSIAVELKIDLLQKTDSKTMIGQLKQNESKKERRKK